MHAKIPNTPASTKSALALPTDRSALEESVLLFVVPSTPPPLMFCVPEVGFEPAEPVLLGVPEPEGPEADGELLAALELGPGGAAAATLATLAQAAAALVAASPCLYGRNDTAPVLSSWMREVIPAA